ncbi:MAG: hypothetical protein RLZZ182_358, partial [Pseudomonadota bacterium]
MNAEQFQEWSTTHLAQIERCLELWVPADAPAGL